MSSKSRKSKKLGKKPSKTNPAAKKKVAKKDAAREEIALARARSKETKDKRLRQVLRLRFVQNWSEEDIAKHLQVAVRTVQRDIKTLRDRFRKNAKQNLDYEMRDVAEELKLRHAETIKLLWNDYLQIEGRINKIESDLDDLRSQLGGEDNKEVLVAISRLQQVLSAMINQGQKLLYQITTTDDSFVEQLRKLGLVHGEIDADPEDGSLLLEIRTRRANIESIRAKNAEAEAKAAAAAGGKT